MKHLIFLFGIMHRFAFAAILGMIFALEGVCQDTSTTETADSTKQLDEFVVKAAKLNTVMEVDGNLTTIKDTELSKLATVIDVFRFVPNLMVNGESVEIIGSGAPVIYVDKRKIDSLDDLDLLTPDRIKSIKVINNPGSKYGGEVRGVILITTYRKPGEGFSLNNRLSMTMSDYFNPSDLLTMNYRTGNWDIFAQITASKGRSKGHSSTDIQLFTPSRTLRTQNSVDNYSSSPREMGKLGFNYTTPSNHSFGAYWQGNFSKVKYKSNDSYQNFIDDILTSSNQTFSNSKSRSRRHRINAFYTGNWGSWTSDINFDFITTKSNGNGEQFYYSDPSTPYYTRSTENKNRLLAGKIELSRPLGGGTLYLGSEYSNTRMTSDFINYENIIAPNYTKMTEYSPAVYAEYFFNIGHLSLSAGLRYEYTHGTYRHPYSEENDVKRIYNEFLPSLSLLLPVRESSWRLSFSRFYNKPIYAWLTNNIAYVNEALYETGNMYLKPAYFNVLNLSYKYSWLMLELRYMYITGKVMIESDLYPGSSDIILDYRVNSPRPLHNYSATATIIPGYIGGFYYPMLTAMIAPQYYRIDFLGKPMKFTHPMGLINFSNLFKISSSFNATLNFQWKSNSDAEAGTLKGNWSLDLSLNKSFGQHWTLQLSANDIFNTARKSASTSYTQYSITEGTWIRNTRNLQLSVVYKFNITKSRYKGTAAAEAEQERL